MSRQELDFEHFLLEGEPMVMFHMYTIEVDNIPSYVRNCRAPMFYPKQETTDEYCDCGDAAHWPNPKEHELW